MEAWRIDQENLRVRLIDDPEDPPPRGLGTWRDDRNLLPYQTVEERRFADVSAPDQRNEAGAMGFDRFHQFQDEGFSLA